MTGVITKNILLCAIVFIEVLGLLTWAILTSRESQSPAQAKSRDPRSQHQHRRPEPSPAAITPLLNDLGYGPQDHRKRLEAPGKRTRRKPQPTPIVHQPEG